VPTAPMVRVQKKCTRQNHRYRRIIRPSLRSGFNGLLQALPGDRAVLPPSSQSALCALQDLAPASGRQDHTAWPSAKRSFVRVQEECCDRLRPPLDRETPLCTRRDNAEDAADFSRSPSGIFFARNLDRGHRLESADEISFLAQAISNPKSLVEAAREMTTERIRARRENCDASSATARRVGWRRRRNPPLFRPQTADYTSLQSALHLFFIYISRTARSPGATTLHLIESETMPILNIPAPGNGARMRDGKSPLGGMRGSVTAAKAVFHRLGVRPPGRGCFARAAPGVG
jgi:hypothetical protein